MGKTYKRNDDNWNSKKARTWRAKTKANRAQKTLDKQTRNWKTTK